MLPSSLSPTWKLRHINQATVFISIFYFLFGKLWRRLESQLFHSAEIHSKEKRKQSERQAESLLEMPVMNDAPVTPFP